MNKIYIEIRINPDDPDDLALEALVNELTDRRELSNHIRAALPLYADLNAGRLDWLFYFFPHLRHGFVPDSVPDKNPYEGTEGQEFLEKMLEVALDGLLPLFRPQFIKHAMEVKNGKV